MNKYLADSQNKVLRGPVERNAPFRSDYTFGDTLADRGFDQVPYEKAMSDYEKYIASLPTIKAEWLTDSDNQKLFVEGVDFEIGMKLYGPDEKFAVPIDKQQSCTKDPNTCQVAFCNWNSCLNEKQEDEIIGKLVDLDEAALNKTEVLNIGNHTYIEKNHVEGMLEKWGRLKTNEAFASGYSEALRDAKNNNRFYCRLEGSEKRCDTICEWCNSSEMQANRDKQEREGEWTYDYNFVNQLTEKVNTLTDYEETVSMEQVESVLIAINYPKTDKQEGKPERMFTLEEILTYGAVCAVKGRDMHPVNYFKEKFNIDL